MNQPEMAQYLSKQRALLSVAQARTRRAEMQSRRMRAAWREHAEALQAERHTLLALDTDIARVRPLAQPNAGRPAVAAATLLAWRDHAQAMLHQRGEQNDKVRIAADIAREAREDVRQAAQAALQANVRLNALAAHVALTQSQRVALADDIQAEDQTDSAMQRGARREGLSL